MGWGMNGQNSGVGHTVQHITPRRREMSHQWLAEAWAYSPFLISPALLHEDAWLWLSCFGTKFWLESLWDWEKLKTLLSLLLRDTVFDEIFAPELKAVMSWMAFLVFCLFCVFVRCISEDLFLGGLLDLKLLVGIWSPGAMEMWYFHRNCSSVPRRHATWWLMGQCRTEALNAVCSEFPPLRRASWNC